MSSESVIEVIGVSKSYRVYRHPQDRLKQMFRSRMGRVLGLPARAYYTESWALHDVSFNVIRGETLGIIGRNGSGKSTILQIICGTLTPTQGTVSARGRIGALLELGAGFNPEFTGRENAILSAQILGLSPREIAARIGEIEAFADIEDFFDRPVKTYSTGMYVRTAFAVQVSIEPDILIVDEALAVGDAAFQAKCIKRLQNLKDQGTSILFVSHDTAAVRMLCDRAIWIDRGKVRLAGDVVPVTAAYLETIFLKTDTAITDNVTDIAGTAEENGLLGNVAKPISRWGTHSGLIRSVQMFDVRGRPTFSFEGREIIGLRINILLPAGLERNGLAIAFSIKTLAGMDLVVGVADEHQIAPDVSSDSSTHHVEFELENFFNTGKYMIAAAVQRGGRLDLSYLEHVEGIAYFQSTQDLELIGGLLLPRITVRSTAVANGIRNVA
jgi:lipopolysaccharide transport system ATP-binding protein